MLKSNIEKNISSKYLSCIECNSPNIKDQTHTTVSKQCKLNYPSEKKSFYESKYEVFNVEMNFEINSYNSRKSRAEVSETIESSSEGRDNLLHLR